MGSGTLLCAIVDHLIEQSRPCEIWVDGFELDEELYSAAQSLMLEAVDYAAEFGIKIHLRLFNTDFVLNGLQFLRPSLMDTPVGQRYYQHIIANPPYFKTNSTDLRRRLAEGILSGHTNIYTLFMSLAARMLQSGNACFIVPRSFCSGTYFARFRREFLEHIRILHVHLFEARDDTFSHDDVLQENVVITYTERGSGDGETIEISSSASLEQLSSDIISQRITSQQFISPLGLFRLPTSDIDEEILKVVDGWDGSLRKFGMEISTGPIVPFRAKQYLASEPNGTSRVPLLWMQHVQSQRIAWPLNHDFSKPQYFVRIAETESQLLKNQNYVLLRRFSAKEEARRLVAAPYLAAHYPFKRIGLENHLNYIYCKDRVMSDEEAIGLSAFLNSGLTDRYFRISNGNTQVNATELRALPLPPLSAIRVIGRELLSETEGSDLDATVIQILQSLMLIPDDFPILRETRVV